MTELVDAVVVALLPEFQLVHLETPGGDTLSVGELTRGVSWRELREGQWLRCTVEGAEAPRVVAAEILPQRTSFPP
jgi:hypothetical protein